MLMESVPSLSITKSHIHWLCPHRATGGSSEKKYGENISIIVRSIIMYYCRWMTQRFSGKIWAFILSVFPYVNSHMGRVILLRDKVTKYVHADDSDHPLQYNNSRAISSRATTLLALILCHDMYRIQPTFEANFSTSHNIYTPYNILRKNTSI